MAMALTVVDRAFVGRTRRGYLLLVGDHQAESLDERLLLGPSTGVSVIRLVPFLGG